MFGFLSRLSAFLMFLSLVVPGVAVGAMQALPPPSTETNVWDAGYVCDRYGCYETRRPRHRPFPPPPIYRPPPPIYRPPPPVYAPSPPVYRPPPGVWSRHVNWCLDRYRSYDPRTNRYRGYDGYSHICRSPYL